MQGHSKMTSLRCLLDPHDDILGERGVGFNQTYSVENSWIQQSNSFAYSVLGEHMHSSSEQHRQTGIFD